jgi:hypothetical protein
MIAILSRSLIFAMFAFALPGSNALAETTVPSLSGVRGAMRTTDAQQMFDHSMSGVSRPDGFGTKLPAGFTTAFLVETLAPGQDPRNVVLSGARPWPLRPNSYVAMICLADNPDLAARAMKYSRASCRSSDDETDPRHLWFGVFESGDADTPRLVARTGSFVTTPTDWRNTNIDLPGRLDSKNLRSAMPASWSRFDLASYQLRTGEFAFGVRAGWDEGYAGGGADFEALYLFVIDGTTLRVVFAEPMAFGKMIAGDWHADGTRSHDVSDAANALTVLPSMTDGYHDLQLREKAGGKWRRTFKWSAAERRYR